MTWLRTLLLVALLGVLGCSQATTKSEVCERDWSSNSDTAMPHEARNDPVASEMYRERYIRICANY